MGRGIRSLRVRGIASSWFQVLVVACVVLAAAGGFAAYTAHVSPGTTTVASERAHWSVDGEFGHSATVTRENPVFDVGETLSNRSTYFTNAAPVLDGQYVATYTGGGSASVTLNATLVVRSVGENTVYWTDRQPLDTTETTLSNGESASVAFSLNASELAERAARIQSELGNTPGTVRSFVVVDVETEGTASGQPASLSFTHRLPIAVDGDTYTVGPAETPRETLTTTQTLTTTTQYGPLWSLGGPLAFLLGAAGLAGLLVGRKRGALELTAAERRYLQFQDERAEFDEWVVSAALPAELRDRPRADAESLSDVVDFAIDTDSGVLEDRDTGTFYAVGDQLVVAYDPPARPADTPTVADQGDASSTFSAALDVTESATEGEMEAAEADADSAAAADGDGETGGNEDA